jgi:CheY-like chemotaxis protein
LQIDEPMPAFETLPPGRYAVLEVTDTGSGINKEDLSHIFDPFFSRKARDERSGSGLGLAVVHGVVKEHGAFIDVASESNKGTTFKVYFPLVDVAADTTGQQSKQAATPKGTERILVIDDERAQRFTTSKNLEKLGYSVSVATNGREGVALFAAAAKEKKETPFDLVILDMTMEIGFDGLHTYQAILELYPSQKVIISSGYADSERIVTARKLGADSLPKPYNRDDLAKALRKRLDRDCCN